MQCVLIRWVVPTLFLVLALRDTSCLTEETLDRQSRTKTSIIRSSITPPNNFRLVGYFSVHETNRTDEANCGKILKNAGIVYVEAMRYALKEISKNNSALLFGFQPLFRIVDTCRNGATLARSFIKTFQDYYMGVVGPTTSEEGSLAGPIHGAREAAVVSHSATSPMFDQRELYKNFFRTIPSDVMQVEALMDIIQFFNWSYVSVVSSHGEYGKWGSDQFKRSALIRGVCIGEHISLPARPKAADFRMAVRDLRSTVGATVVVLITGMHDTEAFLEQASVLNEASFTWLSSTAWEVSIAKPGKSARGALVLRYASKVDAEFEKYFMNLKLEDNNYSWFREFWYEHANCSGEGIGGLGKDCEANKTLRELSFSLQHVYVEPVFDAVYTIVCSLRKSIMKRCPGLDASCINSVKSRTYYFEMDVVEFIRTGNSSCPELPHSVNLNAQGYYNRDFDLMNFDGTSFRKIARWSYNESLQRGSLQRLNTDVVWVKNQVPKSFCSVPCNASQVKRFLSDSCCYECQSCPKNHIVMNNTCIPCRRRQMSIVDKNYCFDIPLVSLRQEGLLRSITVVGSVLGIVVNTIVLCLFVRNRKSRIIKSSSKELSMIILFALYICFLAPCAFLLNPSQTVCGLQRFIVGISLTACYIPVMLKTNRIYRIFNAAQVMTSKPALVSSRSQVLIFVALISSQLLLGVAWVIGDPPEVVERAIENESRIVVLCKTKSFNFIFNLIPCLIVMGASTVYAFKTRKFPSNFNEALNICITMYINCFIWGIFIIVTLFLEARFDDILILLFAIANFPTVIGIVTLLGIFGPKIRKLYVTKDVEPATERFSRFHTCVVESPRVVSLNVENLATIEEDRAGTCYKRTTQDASTNT